MNEKESNADGNGEKKEPKPEAVYLEYQTCAAFSRFIVGLRFTYFASFLTFFIILVGGYHYVWKNDTDFGSLYPYIIFAVAFFGFSITLVAWMIERRNIFLYQSCDRRMATLERRMGVENGIYVFFTSPEGRSQIWRIKISHTNAISLIYSLVTIIWSILLSYSIYRILLV